ncbi:MAG: polysaccharide biosynthesis tyrosine autokinase [Flavobacterium sp.]|nr:polysaccharide biosynthesis tyrosine autokinase [Flavobacterium sp.]
MRQEVDNIIYYPKQNNQFDYKKFLSSIIRVWYWFAISIFIGIFAAWMYIHYMPAEYSIRSSLIVNEYESGIKRLSLSQNNPYERNIDVLGQDHAGRIKSHMLSLSTLQSLGWNVFWYQKTPLYDKDLYENEPYKLTLLPNKTNLTDINVLISELSDSEFQVDVNSDLPNRNIRVKFTAKGKFGEPFENSYFGFTIERLGGRLAPGNKIYFEIKNLNNLALVYQKKLTVITSEKKPDLMELILIENNAQRGVDFLNRLEKTYIEYGLAEKNRVAENTIKFIDSQLKSVTDSLSDSESRFTNFRSRSQTLDLNQEGGIVMQKQGTLESERATIESRLDYLRNLRNIMNDSKQMKQIVVPSVFGITDQTLNNLVARLSDLYSRRTVLSFSAQEKAPSMILLDKELQLTHAMLTQNIEALLSATETDLRNLNRRVGGFSSQLSLLPRTEQQLSSLKRSLELNSELYTYLLKMRAESAITYASNQPDVKVLDPARNETSKQTSPILIIDYIFGLMLGFFIPFSIFVLKDHFRNSIQTKEEVSELTKLPVIGTIIHNRSKNNLVVFENPRSNITESFRLLRTNLKYILSGNDKKVIAVQSTIAGEGKSFISINLASILAMNDLKVLLVGVDMRMSSLHRILKSDNKKGLSTYLSNKDKFGDIIETTAINNLSYITSGPVPPNPAELLENGSFERFMEEAKSRFDYIILDSPPVSLVTDGIITGRHADINLFVVRFRYSSRELIKIINEHDNKKTLPNLFLVLNDATKENFIEGNYYNNRNKGYYGK